MDGWPLMDNPLWTILICLGYFYFVKVLGPKLMQNRPAFELKRILMVYNAFQIVFNFWLFWEAGQSGWFYGKFSFRCEPVDYSNDPSALRIIRAGYWFWISKYIDFLDTIFFILRKKSNQVTTLHVIHHGILPINIWPGLRYANGGNTAVCCVVNSFVHIIMYSYYLLSAMGPRVQAAISKFKKYVTRIQIIQFIAMLVHSFQFLIVADCGFSIWTSIWVAVNELLFLCLFLDFYKNAYGKKHSNKLTNDNNNLTFKLDKKLS